MNTWYAEGAQYIAEGGLNWATDNIKALLVKSSYTPNTAAGGNKFVSDVGAGNILSRSGNFATKTETGGILNAATITFSLPTSGFVCSYIVIYKDTGADATSRLLIKNDTANGLPVTTDGQDISVQWDMGTFKIGAIGIF